MAYDSDLKRMVLFGGYDNKNKNDTWEWKENRWTQIADSGLSPRAGHTIIYDSSSKKVFLFWGSSEEGTCCVMVF